MSIYFFPALKLKMLGLSDSSNLFSWSNSTFVFRLGRHTEEHVSVCSWMDRDAGRKGTVRAELGQRGLFASIRATNSLACISTSACLQWPTRRVGGPHRIPKHSAPTVTINRRPRSTRTKCTAKTEQIRQAYQAVDRKKQGDRQIGEPQPLFLHSILPSVHPSVVDTPVNRTGDNLPWLRFSVWMLLPVAHHHTFDSLHLCRCWRLSGSRRWWFNRSDSLRWSLGWEQRASPLGDGAAVKGGMARIAERVRILPNVFKGIAQEERIHDMYFRCCWYVYHTEQTTSPVHLL